MAGWCGGRVYLILRQYTSPVFTRLSRLCLSMILSLTVLISWFFWPLVSFSCRVVYYIQPPSHYPRRFHRRPAVTKTVTPRFQNFPFGILGSTVQYTVLYLKTLNRKSEFLPLYTSEPRLPFTGNYGNKSDFALIFLATFFRWIFNGCGNFLKIGVDKGFRSMLPCSCQRKQDKQKQSHWQSMQDLLESYCLRDWLKYQDST